MLITPHFSNMIVAENLALTLSPDNVSNTTLVSETGERLYIVITEHTKKDTITTVRNARDDVIASLEWRDVLPDRVIFGDTKPTSMAEWMRRSVIPFKDDITFTDDEGRKYKWKGNSAGRSFELSCADDNFSTIIARFQRSRRVHMSVPPETDASASTLSLAPTLVNHTQTPAILTLAPRAQQIQDLVVASFLFLEKTRSINETEHQSRADMLGSPMKPVGRNVAVVDGGV